jgi:hypothetical protein
VFSYNSLEQANTACYSFDGSPSMSSFLHQPTISQGLQIKQNTGVYGSYLWNESSRCCADRIEGSASYSFPSAWDNMVIVPSSSSTGPAIEEPYFAFMESQYEVTGENAPRVWESAG